MSIHILEFNRLVWEYTISRFYQKFPVDYVFIFAIYGFLTFSYQLCYNISWFYIRKVLVKSISYFPPPELIFENKSETESEASEWETQSESELCDPPITTPEQEIESDTESEEKEYRVVRKRQRNSI
jgi:hypothetical protein